MKSHNTQIVILKITGHLAKYLVLAAALKQGISNEKIKYPIHRQV